MKAALIFWTILMLKWIQRNILDKILDFTLQFTTLQGSQISKTERNHYISSAQRVKIWARGAYSSASVHTLRNYLYTHLKNCHPEFILEADNVTLQGIDGQFAWFSVTDPRVNVYDLSRFPFVWVAQYLWSKELIIMPIGSFFKLASNLPDPGTLGKDVIMLFNTARCGSTLFCQMFDKIPNTRSMSEPWSTVVAHVNYNGGLISNHGDVYEEIIKSCIKIQCKDEKKSNIKRIFYKQPTWASAQIPIIKKVCPNIKFIFNTRHPKSSLVSFNQMAKSSVLSNVLKYDLKIGMHQLAPLPYNDPKGIFKLIRQNILEHMDAKSIDEFSALAYGSSLIGFLNHRHFFRQIILYEDFLELPWENTKDIFDILEVPEEHISKSLTALDKHSQGKFFGNTDGTKNDALVTEQWQKIMRIFQTLDVPVSPYMTLNEFRLLMFQK